MDITLYKHFHKSCFIVCLVVEITYTLISVLKLVQFDIDNFQEKFADLKWAAGKRQKMVESSSWPPGAAAETKSFMVLLFIINANMWLRCSYCNVICSSLLMHDMVLFFLCSCIFCLSLCLVTFVNECLLLVSLSVLLKHSFLTLLVFIFVIYD